MKSFILLFKKKKKEALLAIYLIFFKTEKIYFSKTDACKISKKKSLFVNYKFYKLKLQFSLKLLMLTYSLCYMLIILSIII